MASLLGVMCALTSASAARAEEAQTEIRPLRVGEATVEVVSKRGGDGRSPIRWLLVNLHDDENTSVDAAERILADYPCRLVELKHSGERHVVFTIDGAEFGCDPNRIFTPAGVRATLEKISSRNDAAEQEVLRFGQSLIEHYRLNQAQAVIALHNNMDQRYAATSYVKGQAYETDAESVHLQPGKDADDFYFVTERRFFDALTKRGFNAVLQNNQSVTDDGSLSVYCAQHDVPYVNVEAQHGHLDVQVSMLQALFEVLNEMKQVELVNLHDVDSSFIIDSPYATAANMAKTQLYPKNELYLERSAAERLAKVQKRLQSQDLGLKVFDAYRPLSVQKKLWQILPDPRYVANPVKGSRHNRGSAVDVTLVDKDGNELPMPTEFDEFSEKAHHDYADLPIDVLRNRQCLKDAMLAAGFQPLSTEWWHYDAPDWRAFPVLDEDPWATNNKPSQD
jgi:D-alanyl-D-alanine dipeptidase